MIEIVLQTTQMEIREVSDENQWEDFLNEARPHTFLQSWKWGEFNEQTGNKIWRLGIFENDAFLGVALIIKTEARRGSFLFCPHGPITITNFSIFNFQFSNILKNLTAYLKDLAIQEKVSFIRMSPLLAATPENISIFRDYGFRDAPVHMMHPERAWILDITPSEETLLKNMRKQTRHCIKNAREAGVKIAISRSSGDIAQFYRIYQTTVDRQGFVPFSPKYLEEEFKTFAAKDNALIFFGEYKNDIISTAMIVFANGSAFYHHSASSLKYPKIPASHFLQWEVIREAKRRGCLWYNFWGIAPEAKPNHPWAGLTLFKKGFGGLAEEYVHAQDLALSPQYWLTYAIEAVRRIKRRL